MKESPERSLWSREALIVFVVSLLAVVAIQWRSSAFEAEFAQHPDESSHFVSAMLVYDYLAHGAPESPMAYAERYYIHYPKVGIGHWPPGFHGVLGLWLLAFGVGRVQVMLFMAVTMAAGCCISYMLARFIMDRVASAAAVALLIALPLCQASYISVMTEAPLALACLAAVWAYVQYLRAPGWRPAVAFGLFAAFGLLVKATAIALAFVPLLSIIILRRPQLLKRLDFWAPAVIVLALAGPWYAVNGDLVPSAMGGTLDRVFSLRRQESTWGRAEFWAFLAGLPMLASAVVGWTHAALKRPSGSTPFLAASSAFLFGAIFLNQTLPESAEPRHIHHAAAFVAVFAAAAFAWLSDVLPRPARPVVWVLAAALFLLDGYRLLHKESYGLVEAAQAIDADPNLDRSLVLITSQEFGEGAFISEMALLNPHPRHVVIRGNQLLARVGWSNYAYSSVFQETEDVVATLEAETIQAVVVDQSPLPGPQESLLHHELIQAALALRPGDWTMDRFPGEEDRGAALARTTVRGRTRTRPIRIYRGFYSFNPMELPASDIAWQP